MPWSETQAQEFLQTIRDLWPSREEFGPQLEDLWLQEMDPLPHPVVLKALRKAKADEEFPRLPTIQAVKALVKDLTYDPGAEREASTKEQQIRLLEEKYYRRIWSGGKTPVMIEKGGLRLINKPSPMREGTKPELDKYLPGWILPWGDCTEADLRRVLHDLVRS